MLKVGVDVKFFGPRWRGNDEQLQKIYTVLAYQKYSCMTFIITLLKSIMASISWDLNCTRKSTGRLREVNSRSARPSWRARTAQDHLNQISNAGDNALRKSRLEQIVHKSPDNETMDES
jgi:hypothetical protein